MSAAAAILSRSWPVGQYTVTLTVPRPIKGSQVHASVEWSPFEPRRLSKSELAKYRAERNRAIAELAAELEINVAVLEV